MTYYKPGLWSGGFNYDRSHPTRNKVAIQTYKILIHYTQVHKNCRVGAYLSVRGFSEFYPLRHLIPNFDAFAEVAEKDLTVSPRTYYGFKKNSTGTYFQEQVEEVWRLKYPIYFEIMPKTSWKNFFGYSFNRPFKIKINPSDINQLEGLSLDSFTIMIKDYQIKVKFRDEISIE
jgi:hypothetical protein